MSRILRQISSVLLLMAIAGAARALEWKKTEIATAPEPGADVVRARYEFKNTGRTAVQILEVRSSCGCTEATPSASKFAPGESGAVDVLFTIGQRTGLQEKEITLFTDDAKVPTRLRLKVKLPEPAAVAR